MSFCNSHIKCTVWKLLHHISHRTTCRHSRCHPHNPVVFRCQLNQCMAENILKQRRFNSRRSDDSFPCFLIEFTRSVPFGSRLLSRFETFSFHGTDMQKFWPLHILYIIQHFHHIVHIVTVNRTEVTYTESFEQIMLLRNQCFQTVIKAQDTTATVFRNQIQLP